jgi:hypothetical protein
MAVGAAVGAAGVWPAPQAVRITLVMIKIANKILLVFIFLLLEKAKDPFGWSMPILLTGQMGGGMIVGLSGGIPPSAVEICTDD